MAIRVIARRQRPCNRINGAGIACTEPVLAETLLTDVPGSKAVEVALCRLCDRPDPPTPWYTQPTRY